MAIDGFDNSGKERLSALVDGELDRAESAACCAAWDREADLRADWHAWHLIGDVLRSEELAVDPLRDRRLAAAIRAHLQHEPIVLAPAAAAVRRFDLRERSGRWAAGAAGAAGVVLVAGTFALVRPGDAPAPAQVARGDVATVVASAAARAPSGSDAPAPAVAVVADNKLIRDAQLDRYLEAHKQFSGTSALGVPSAFLRSATVDSASR